VRPRPIAFRVPPETREGEEFTLARQLEKRHFRCYVGAFALTDRTVMYPDDSALLLPPSRLRLQPGGAIQFAGVIIRRPFSAHC
jgi:hypothetical protein